MKPEVQEFLASLDEADVVKIQKVLRVCETVEALAWFVKWAALSLLAVAVFITQVKDQIKALFN